MIVCHSDEEWQRLVQVMGAPSWATAAKFATVAGRLQHQEELDEQHRSVEHDAGKVRADGALPGRRRSRPSGAKRRGPGGA